MIKKSGTSRKRKLSGCILSAILAVTMAAPCVSCAKNRGVDATVFAVGNTIKILREVEYPALYGGNTLEMRAFKNETEGAQIIFRPAADVKEYDLVVSDLTDGAGHSIPKEDIEVFGEKYIKVDRIFDAETRTGVGMYPDAIVPLSNLKACGETSVKAGDNQGIYVKIKPAKDAAAGVYTGNFTLRLDGSDRNVPVRVEVLDYTLSDAKHTKSDFGINWSKRDGTELDSTIEMQEAYYEFFIEHRIDPSTVPGNQADYSGYADKNSEYLDTYIEMLAKYTADERVGTIQLPYVRATFSDETGSGTCVNLTRLEELLTKIMDYTLEHEINLFKKLHTYFMFLDEDTERGQVVEANYTLKTTSALYDSMAKRYEAEWTAAGGSLNDFQREVLSDLKNIRNLLVGPKIGTMTAPATYVPTIDRYSNDAALDDYYSWLEHSYDDPGYRELWTYTCVQPTIPYPTYHLEDEILSARMMSWMMYEYNIVGNLMWQAALNGRRGGSDGSVQADYFQNQYDVANKYANANGDGFTVYSGREYGIYGPVSSIRLESILDGEEDYELMYALEAMYKERAKAKGRISDEANYNGDEFDSILHMLTRELYGGKSFTAYDYKDGYIEYFENSRKTLEDLLLLADNFGMIVENASESRGTVTVTLSAPDGVTVRRGGSALSGTSAGGITTYEFDVRLDKDVNEVELSAEKNGASRSVTLDLGKKSMGVAPEDLDSHVTIAGGEHSVEEYEGGKALKLAYNVTDDGGTIGGNTAIIDGLASLGVDDGYAELTMEIVADRGVTLMLAGSGDRKGALIKSIGTIGLKAGTNVVKINLSALNLQMDGNLNMLRLRLGEDTPPGRYELKIISVTIGG